MGTFIRLFLFGLMVVILFKVAVFMLPFVILGYTIIFLREYFGNREKNDIIVRSE